MEACGHGAPGTAPARFQAFSPARFASLRIFPSYYATAPYDLTTEPQRHRGSWEESEAQEWLRGFAALIQKANAHFRLWTSILLVHLAFLCASVSLWSKFCMNGVEASRGGARRFDCVYILDKLTGLARSADA